MTEPGDIPTGSDALLMNAPQLRTALILLVFPLVAGASTPEDSPPPASTEAAAPLRAIRARDVIAVNGALDEPDWAQAPVFDGFVQSFPDSGAPPGQRTEVRILYDDQNIYFGIRCKDSQPALINGGLGRRDQPPLSDLVSVALDTTLEGRTAYLFAINASGVLQDGLLLQDTEFTETWDAPWEGATLREPDGWVVEMRIPLHSLRFPAAPEQRWGVGIRREIARTHEQIDSVLMPRDANARVSRFNRLSGLENLQPRRRLELLPTVATRVTGRPRFSDPSRPTPTLLGPSADLGLDLTANLTSQLVLSATVNPDFGQVEADQLVNNFSTFESFFPEKRPFFTQGMELFEPVGVEDGQSEQRLFYSRRIGLETPILAAAKVTGTLTEGWELGVLDALVASPADSRKWEARLAGEDLEELEPDRRFQLHLRRPFRFGLNDELPSVPVLRNHLTAVIRGEVSEGLTLGGTLAGATPLERPCEPSLLPETADPALFEECSPVGSAAGALDWNLRTGDGEWVFRGQVAGSRLTHGPEEGVLLYDGTMLRPGDSGLGAYFRAGRLGGEPWQFDVRYEYSSPKLELNPTGFQRTQNEQVFAGHVGFVRLSGWGPLLDFSSGAKVESRWTTDGRFISRGTTASVDATATLPGFTQVSCLAEYNLARFDVREIYGTGIPFERPSVFLAQCSAATDASRLLSLEGGVLVGRTVSSGPIAAKGGAGGELAVTLRPRPWLQTQVHVASAPDIDGPRWVDTLAEDRFRFGGFDTSFLSLTLRQLVVVSPRLTVEAYGQLFTAYGRFDTFHEAPSQDRSTIRLVDLQPTEGPEEDINIHETALQLNFVVRWEYRLGSTLFFVYSRSQQQLPPPLGEPVPTNLKPGRIFQGPSNDVVLLKLSYAWDV
jgi:hypothetical protein